MDFLSFSFYFLDRSEVIALSIVLWLSVEIFQWFFYIEVVLVLGHAAHYIGSLRGSFGVVIVILERKVWIYSG